MKKVLLSSAAVLGLVAFAPAANAQDGGLSLDVGGHFKGYGVYTDQDDNLSGTDAKGLDMLRETEVHLTGETTLDNGLTVGAHVEAEVDDGNDNFTVDESYAYFAGGWGRVNLGSEDGANYLLQVSAPSADSNVDGIRQFIQPVNYNVLSNGNTTGNVQFDYANDFTEADDKFTYLTPNVQGFQAGVSYTPDTGANTRSLTGVTNVDDGETHNDVWDIAARYEGEFDELGVNLGAGYTHASEAENTTAGVGANNTDFVEWNIGADLDWGPFGLGAVYTENNNNRESNPGGDDNETWVIGADYTQGPFKVGGSYYTNDDNSGRLGLAAGNNLSTDRYTGGVNYSFGPGMSFRGSVSYIDHEAETGNIPGSTDDNADATSILLGTQVNF